MYRTCPYCGANNDPCEICDCQKPGEQDPAQEDNEKSDDACQHRRKSP